METNYFENKVILITGGSGSFGSFATEKLLAMNPREIKIFSRSGAKQRILAQKIKRDKRVKFIIGDVKDSKKVISALSNVDIVIHAAANKYVDLCQKDPQDAITTNVIGTQNVINASLKNKIKFVINLGADKAVYPTSVYGATKYLSEVLFTSASLRNRATRFINIRYSNVLGSAGSVVEIFREKLLSNQTINVFDPESERLVLTQEDVWKLIETSLNFGKGGETFIYLAPKLKILDLAQIMRRRINNGKIKKGKNLRPGERVGAYLISNEESKRTRIINNKIAVIVPENFPNNFYKKFKLLERDSYSVENSPRLSKTQLSHFLDLIERLN